MTLEKISEYICKDGEAPDIQGEYRIYPHSIHRQADTVLFMMRISSERYLVVVGNEALSGFEGEVFFAGGVPAKKCPLTARNAKAVMDMFPFTRPVSSSGHPFTLGLGDRLGLASPGHLQLLRSENVFPILAQQSMRELMLTARTYDDVLASAAFSVFQEDWQKGYGADGDHLKTADEIHYALDRGYTMITLDCSEHILDIQSMTRCEINARYAALPSAVRSLYEEHYSNKTFAVGTNRITIDDEKLKSIVLVYDSAIQYVEKIYHEIIKGYPRAIDFEISIDETSSPTSPEAHFIVASELKFRDVRFLSLAPRFIGEFQKGIDYIGSTEDFEKDFIVHADIARHFGYKLSIHSGSDKFSVFGIIGKHTGLNVHVKTAGTNWLLALSILAKRQPDFFKEIYKFALDHFNEAKAYYHVSTDTSKLPPFDSLTDEHLVGLLHIPEARQVLHITYGLILTAVLPDGSSIYKSKIYELLGKYEDDYSSALMEHIGRHIREINQFV